MSYDGIIMQRAIARFDQARQRREAELDRMIEIPVSYTHLTLPTN